MQDALKKAVIELMAEKSFDDITIQVLPEPVPRLSCQALAEQLGHLLERIYE